MHHLNSQTRWYDLPKEFVKNQEKIYENGGLTFTNCMFQQLCIYSFTWQYRKLYEHYVPLGPKQVNILFFLSFFFQFIVLKNILPPQNTIF